MNRFCSALAQAQTPSMTGTWNVEITFVNERHHSLRFDAQSDGKGSLQLTDPAAKVWVGAKPSEAKWSRGEGNSVTFSGPVEFLLGNVGRDPGTLTCKGKFESADLISGEVEFSPSWETGHRNTARSKRFAAGHKFRKFRAACPPSRGSAREVRCVAASLVAGCHFKKRREDARAL